MDNFQKNQERHASMLASASGRAEYIRAASMKNEDGTNVDPEDWQDWHSEELLDAWTRIKEYQDTNYIKINSKYPKFVEFIISQNKNSLIDAPTRTEETLWGLVSNIPVIYNNVFDIQFYQWVRQNIDHYSNV